tara:strand:+ start:9451 stop:10092 length:642 start_codon:yes stop_codon:yes gene_type:complete
MLLSLLSGGYLSWQWLTMSDKPVLRYASLLPAPLPLASFSLLDHQQQPFDNRRLYGRWHLISYGYTSCPDICPLTLAKLSHMQLQLAGLSQFNQLQLLFYSVDPQRDSPAVLAEYVDFFAGDIIGLVANPAQPRMAREFEQSLGLQVQIDPALQATGEYPVDHGVLLYLLNPQAELQAVFKPVRQYNALPEFDAELLLQDYLTIRRFLAQQTN